ncbi:family 20 glycosylhydrolase [Flavobacterium sp. ENC]|uniref:family 20 glycosylhydrolase n=1 Tax=Flavobacterium sp. ENC TaxID=2897330 RepID=UPI0021074F90|nr:family 20 glycosylhydrolase [Flavobacterium sp. ENC]
MEINWKDSPYFFDGNPFGGYYTQEEIKEVVKFAEAHYVNIIPEIEMPCHVIAAVTAYLIYRAFRIVFIQQEGKRKTGNKGFAIVLRVKHKKASACADAFSI